MRKIFLVFISVCAFFLFYRCGDNTPSENKLKYEVVKYEKQSAGCDSLREDNCAKIKIEFPEITEYENETIKNKVNKSIENLFSSSGEDGAASIDFNSQMEVFINDYESFIKEYPDAFQSWFIERTGEVKFNKENIFSIDYMEYSYTGGAHPNTYVTFKNFLLTNGEEISLDEIISEDKQQELTKIAEAEFRKMKELSPDADLGQAGFWFENNKFYLNDNFLIGDSSLVFYYNNYEITAYAFGPTELTIPYSELKSIIDNKSAFYKLVK